jgi:hypothetical protein
LQMIRHGDNLNLSPRRSGSGIFREPIIPVVNATFGLTAASSPCFWRRVAQLVNPQNILWTSKTLRRRPVNDD